MSKYDPLLSHLARAGREFVPMSFAEIEKLLGFALPPSARDHRAWWSNNPSNNVMTKAWLAAGYETEDVDMASERLVFHRARKGEAGSPHVAEGAKRKVEPKRVSIIGILKGTVTLAPGTDLTEPTGDHWDADA